MTAKNSRLSQSERLFREAQKYLPGGVDSPVRAFAAVGGTPPFIVRGRGPRIFDADGNEYIDFVGSWGPLILGHAYPSVVAALQRVAEGGTSFGAPTELETTLAKMVCNAMPSIQKIRFVSSGTEATMSALRLARAYTGKSKIIKFDGCYHGHADGLLVSAGSGLATLGIPSSAGIPTAYAKDTLVAPYNDFKTVERIFRRHPKDIAAVIVEPVAANMGLVLPVENFLPQLRQITAAYGALLIFDEVITGFRVGYGGAQEHFRIKPDITCLGKIIGGGLPVGAYGGCADIMDMVAPAGRMYQAGTLSGNPLAMTAGIETLKVLQNPGLYQRLETQMKMLAEGITDAAKRTGVAVQVPHTASMLTVFFSQLPVTDYSSAKKSDTSKFAKFFHTLLSGGVYWPCSQFETAFLSITHTENDIRSTLDVIEKGLEATNI